MSTFFKFKDPKIAFEDLQVHNARNEPFEIFGFLNPKESGLFKRLPLDVAENTSENTIAKSSLSMAFTRQIWVSTLCRLQLKKY